MDEELPKEEPLPMEKALPLDEALRMDEALAMEEAAASEPFDTVWTKKASVRGPGQRTPSVMHRRHSGSARSHCASSNQSVIWSSQPRIISLDGTINEVGEGPSSHLELSLAARCAAFTPPGDVDHCLTRRQNRRWKIQATAGRWETRFKV